eukprot:CAMPEP_0171312442 /NCGR_PEP_ID=MMETSP0816-20121228/22678_1 /TAXON_ID=420281 /ORGANISM="Proboscia inermis, Strain CCAP1064/1" /LENGTH=169 /DNA_ID=CAMNT_0011797801 /DNA_START=7 /DNA_END=516 /DNA_ORIENTATION=-
MTKTKKNQPQPLGKPRNESRVEKRLRLEAEREAREACSSALPIAGGVFVTIFLLFTIWLSAIPKLEIHQQQKHRNHSRNHESMKRKIHISSSRTSNSFPKSNTNHNINDNANNYHSHKHSNQNINSFNNQPQNNQMNNDHMHQDNFQIPPAPPDLSDMPDLPNDPYHDY